MSDRDTLLDAGREDDVWEIVEGLGFSAEDFGRCEREVYRKASVSSFEMRRALFGSLADGGVRA